MNISDRTYTIIRPASTNDGKQGFSYFEGISVEGACSDALCMHLLTIPPGGRAKAHLHQNHETAIYVLAGEADMLWYAKGLTEHLVVKTGEFLYIPAGMSHLPRNLSEAPCTAVFSRTDPNEQESVVLRLGLDDLPHLPPR